MSATKWRELAANTSGGGGIRTHGRLPFTRFPSVPIRPLSHSSSSLLRIGGGPAVLSRAAVESSARVGRIPICVSTPRSGRTSVGKTIDICSGRWRPGPVQPRPVNRVRAGRQQLSAEPGECRRSPGRYLRGQMSTANPGRHVQPTPVIRTAQRIEKKFWVANEMPLDFVTSPTPRWVKPGSIMLQKWPSDSRHPTKWFRALSG